MLAINGKTKKDHYRVTPSLLILWGMLFSVQVLGFLVSEGKVRFHKPIQLRLETTPKPVIYELFGRIKHLGLAVSSEAHQLEMLLKKLSFDLSEIRRDRALVPALFLQNLPNDLSTVNEIILRKKLFIKILLPLVIKQNSLIMAERKQLQRVSAKKISLLTKLDKNWIISKAKYYKISRKDGSDEDTIKYFLITLKRRIDIIPVSLAIAQSALETGWGTSRFSISGNALFGQWTWEIGRGIIPTDREPGKNHSIRSFSQLSESVSDYAQNLNTSEFYKNFRLSRAKLRSNGNSISEWGIKLTRNLKFYSAEKSNYIETLKRIISKNNLSSYEKTSIAILLR